LFLHLIVQGIVNKSGSGKIKALSLAYPFIMEGKYFPSQLTFLFGKERSKKKEGKREGFIYHLSLFICNTVAP
jgi:hypothetical protein